MPGFGAALGRRSTSYKPRLKSSKPQATTPGKPKLGTAKQGPGGLGANAAKPGFKTPPAATKPKPRPALAPQSQQPDSIYNSAVDLAGRKEEQALTDLGGQETAVKRDFGIEDPTDPFSRVNALKNTFLARQKARSVGIAGQGLLYSGTHERAMARTRNEEEQARSELRKAYEAAIGAIGAQKAGVKFNSEEERAQAFEDWLARAPEADAPADPEADPAAGDAAVVPGPEAPPKGAPKGTLGAPGPAKGLVGTVSQGTQGVGGNLANSFGNQNTGFGKPPTVTAKNKKAAEFQKKADAAKARLKAEQEAKKREGAARMQVARKPAPKVTAKKKGR